MDSISIEVLHGVAALNELAEDAQIAGNRMVTRLTEEWTDGTNRFDQPGESIHVAKFEEKICAVCGLNVDPFAGDPTVGRVRRLYVAVAYRRRGVGSAIMIRLMTDAKKHFKQLHLRTYDAVASSFYLSIGFTKVEGDTYCTHRLIL